MKIVIALILFCLTIGYASAQGSADLEQTVKRIMTSGGYSGWEDKKLSAAGDSGAVALTRVIGETQLNSNEIDSALTILTLSFASPQGAELQSDSQPRTALFVLRYLELSTKDQHLLQRIANTKISLEKRAKQVSEKKNTTEQTK